MFECLPTYYIWCIHRCVCLLRSSLACHKYDGVSMLVIALHFSLTNSDMLRCWNVNILFHFNKLVCHLWYASPLLNVESLCASRVGTSLSEHHCDKVFVLQFLCKFKSRSKCQCQCPMSIDSDRFKNSNRKRERLLPLKDEFSKFLSTNFVHTKPSIFTIICVPLSMCTMSLLVPAYGDDLLTAKQAECVNNGRLWEQKTGRL